MIPKGRNPAKDALLTGEEKFALGKSIHVMGESNTTSLCYVDIPERDGSIFCDDVIQDACRWLHTYEILPDVNPKTMALRNTRGEIIDKHSLVRGGETVHLCSVKGTTASQNHQHQHTHHHHHHNNNNAPPPMTLVMYTSPMRKEIFMEAPFERHDTETIRTWACQQVEARLEDHVIIEESDSGLLTLVKISDGNKHPLPFLRPPVYGSSGLPDLDKIDVCSPFAKSYTTNTRDVNAGRKAMHHNLQEERHKKQKYSVSTTTTPPISSSVSTTLHVPLNYSYANVKLPWGPTEMVIMTDKGLSAEETIYYVCRLKGLERDDYELRTTDGRLVTDVVFPDYTVVLVKAERFEDEIDGGGGGGLHNNNE